MAASTKNGLKLVGVIFSVLGVFKLLTGGDWVVWIILGVLFGGLSLFRRKESVG